MSSSDELKLKKVVLFKAGIGSFQKQGMVDLEKTKSVKISFKNSVMNDLLKTFSILRLSGDLVISGVSYEAQNTNREKLLEDSQINLPSQNAFSALIKQLRGVSVRLKKFDNEIEGQVIGIQSFQESPTGQAIIDKEYVLLSLADGKVQPIAVNEITGLDILDPTIKEDFKFFLETIAGQNREKNKTITIFFSGNEKSDYILNFLQEIPAWKTSYRIFLKSKNKNEQEDKSTSAQKSNTTFPLQLQSWAIIDNVLDEDWHDVDLTLVTGLPVSFIYDSYSPAWVIRPVVKRKTDLGVKVVQYDREVASSIAKSGRTRGIKKRKKERMYAKGGAASAPMLASLGATMGMRNQNAEGIEMNEGYFEAEPTFEPNSEEEGGKGMAFKYHIKNPVFVKRNNSSLIPLLQEDLNGKFISVYNKEVNPKNPMQTLEFINSSTTLENGPVSIFKDDTFAGEAMLPFLEAEGKCRLPFAVDQGVEITVKQETASTQYHEIEIKDAIFKRYFNTLKVKYLIRNLDQSFRQLIIEHPKKNGYELYDTQDPDENTSKLFRFIFNIKSEESMEVIIKERYLTCATDQASYLTMKIIDEWKKLGLVNDEEYDHLKERIKLELERKEIQEKQNSLNDKIRYIESEQVRLRNNLIALKNSMEERNLREKYITKFDRQESELETILKNLIELKENLDVINKKIGFTVENYLLIQSQNKMPNNKKNFQKGG